MPYHRLGLADRTRPAAWWRALIELLVLVGLVIVFVAISSLLLGLAASLSGRDYLDLLSGTTDPLSPLVQVLLIAAILPAPFLAALIAGRRPRALHSTALRLRWGVLGRSLAVVGAVYAVSLLIDVLRGAADATFNQFRLTLIAALLIAVPLQSAAEEYVFRGALPQILGQWRAPGWLAYALPGVLFVASHTYNWIGLIDIAVFAVCTAVLTWRTGGLEAGIALHAVGNTVFFCSGAVDMLDPNATEIGWQQMLGASLMTIVCTILLLWALKGVSADQQKPLVPADETA